MERYVINDIDSFRLKDIFECGQCFRWNKNDDGSYVGVINNTVVKVKQEKNSIIFTGSDSSGFEDTINNYFDLNEDYASYKKRLRKVDKYLNESVEFGDGIRILNQDLWETIISFIISANNNIPRIKKIIENLSKTYGKRIVFEGKEYYTFPSIDSLSKASVQDLRDLGVGFRDKRIYSTTQMIKSGEIDLENIRSLQDTDLMREKLLKLDGVGPKVADCILLFALHRFDVFPIDVWVRRVMNDLYIHCDEESRVSKREINRIADEKYGEIKGLAQQYLFYWKREED
ncbi:MAG: 8-oxoguanine DNA glycosylase [Clostridia bacterium]|nr:8-oxoguanine DNA glycosylase [Clostridia bacterium]